MFIQRGSFVLSRVPPNGCELPFHHILSRDGRSRDRHEKYRPGSNNHRPQARRPFLQRMLTPHPAVHPVHAFGPSQSWRPRRAHARGATLTLLTSVTACIPRSLAGPDHSRCRSALVCAQRRLSTSSRTLRHAAPRHGARPKVRPSPCHASMLPHDHAQPLSHTSTPPSTAAA